MSKILIVDDDPAIIRVFRFIAENEGYEALTAADGEDGVAQFEQSTPDLVFLDINLPKIDGLQALMMMKQRNTAVPVIIITGEGTMQAAVKAMQQGAFDYLSKPLDLNNIKAIIKNALKTSLIISSSSKQPELQFGEENPYQIVGKSGSIQEIYKLIGSISITSNYTSVLITGESGTGKELVARAIHANGKFSEQPFTAVNCTALPETLMESELFGHEKGAFTGAIERRLGKFEVAGQGTIFLDEIGDLSPQLQQKLLRVLQEREFERLGGNKTLPVHARFITATNRDLPSMVKDGFFREDLFFRLKVADIRLPPLRERKEDLEMLAHYFLTKYNKQLTKTISGFSPEALEKLESYSFPGNIRELENLVHKAVILTTRDFIAAETIDDEMRSLKKESGAPAALRMPIVSRNFSESRDYVIELFEKQFIKEILQQYRGNVSAAATASGMTRQNLHRLLTKHKLTTESFK